MAYEEIFMDDLTASPEGNRLTGPAETVPGDAHEPYAALRFPDYRYYAAGQVISVVGQQMLGVAVGWQLYRLTGSATALGLVGLVQALPVIFLTLPSGHLADHFDRKRIMLISQLLVALCSAALTLLPIREWSSSQIALLEWGNEMLRRTAVAWGEPGARFTDPAIPLVYAILLLMAVARALNNPARVALLPQIVPLAVFSNAVAWNTSGFQVAAVAGPALGGLLIGWRQSSPAAFALVYGIATACALTQFALTLPIAARSDRRPGKAIALHGLAVGVRFVWRTKIVLAALTLDLFAVLLGGATALLPIFAERLHVGAVGLGWLRAAPAIGAFAMALLIAHRPPMRRAGKSLLWSVAGFGVATIVFGLSPWFWLSLLMLLLTGAFDNVSVVVRHTLVQVLTPDEMRGRVSAVNNVFIGLSNEMGAMESGLTAALFGPVLSVVGGGIGTILVVLAVVCVWPQVRQFGSLDQSGAGAH